VHFSRRKAAFCGSKKGLSDPRPLKRASGEEELSKIKYIRNYFFYSYNIMVYKKSYKRKSKASKSSLRTGSKPSSMKAVINKVNALSKRMQVQNTPILFGRFASNNVVAPYLSYGLDQYNSMSTIFGTQSNDTHTNRAIDKSDVMDITVQLANNIQTEPGTTNFTCYLVQLKDAIGTNYTSTGAINLIAGTHYQSAPFAGANVLLNLKYFKILKSKKFILTNYDQPLTASSGNTQDTFKRWTWKLRRNQVIQNPEGDFAARPPIDPSNARFLLVFTDDVSTDTQSPFCTINQVKSMVQIA